MNWKPFALGVVTGLAVSFGVVVTAGRNTDDQMREDFLRAQQREHSAVCTTIYMMGIAGDLSHAKANEHLDAHHCGSSDIPMMPERLQ